MKKNKRLFAVTLVLVASMALSNSAFAASTSTSGSIGGVSVSGNLTMATNSSSLGYATASTWINASPGYLDASVVYKYKWGYRSDIYTVSNSTSQSATSVSTTATSNHVNPVHYSANATHRVSWSSYVWNGYTSL
ncbi:hypothetical protein DFP94_11138 [Fontibacillus phaseoli]|uniref:Lactococcin 972 family bacteriocin n=1 Tax=Fontibacillus phaseoli TaxID=1416533 RepID=A0A369B5H6_9BACL|nr:hypothetical protein DFP94_11138 [Fontibacillus phaseoli]